MKQTIITILLAFVAMAGQAQVKPDTVTVSLKLASKSQGEMATVLYPDFVTLQSVKLSPVTDKEGCWTVKIPTFRTLHIEIWDDNKIQGVVWSALDLWCKPGTRTDIMLDDVNDRCVFTGENAEVHNAQVAHPLKIKNLHGRVFGMKMQEAAKTLREIHEQNLHNIDTLFAAHPSLPSDYVEMLRSKANYEFAMDMTQNLLGHLSDALVEIREKKLNTLPQAYQDLLREVKTKELLHPKGLITHDATTFLRDVIRLEREIQNGPMRAIEEDGADTELRHVAQVYPVIDALDASEEVKQIMKTSYFLNNCGEGLTPEREAFLRKELNHDGYSMLLNHIKAKKGQFEAITVQASEKLEEAPIDSLVDGKEIFQKLILPYRGRIIYVDIWGTWCGPCMREMEYVRPLHDALKGFPVTYMYLANSSPEELWKKTSRRFGLGKDNCVNLRLPVQQQKAVESFLQVNGFPTFLLIDSDGAIVTNDAPRPSQANDVKIAVEKLIK